jgi:hypothetical protein
VRLWVAVLSAFEFAECLFVALKSGLTNPMAGLGVVVLDTLADCVEVAKLELGFGVAMIGGPAIPRGGLRVAEWDALPGVIEVGQLLLGFGKVLGCGQTIPMGSFGVALRDPFSFAIHEAEVVLRPREAAMGGALAPRESFSEVVGCIVAKTQVGLRIGVALLGCLALPLGSLGVVVRQTLTCVVHRAEEVLGLGVALLAGKPEAGSGFGEVARVEVGDSLLVMRIGGCVGSIAAAAGDDAGARGMQRQRAPCRDVLQARLNFIFHAR